MKRHPIKYITGLFYLSLIFISSCQKNESSSMVGSSHPYYIEAYLESGQTGIVHISLTQNSSGSLQHPFLTRDAAFNFYKNLKATVLLLKDNQVVDTLNQLSCQGKDFLIIKGRNDIGNTDPVRDTTTRYWYLQGKSHLIEQGGNYKMFVRIPSHPDMIASCIVPQKIMIQELDTINPHVGSDGGGWTYPRNLLQGTSPTNSNDILLYYVPGYIYQVTFTDPSSVKNYYQVETYSKCRSVTSVNYSYYDPRFGNLKLEPSYLYHFNPIFENKYIFNNHSEEFPFFNDKLFDGRQFKVDVKPLGRNSDSLVYFNLVSMSQGYYERKKSEDLYMANLNNTFASPTELYSNFSNAVGFLAGRSVSRDSIRLILYDNVPEK